MSDLFIFGFSSTSKPKIDLSFATITLGTSLTYNGTEQTQTIASVTVNGTTLTAGTDYAITDNTATNAGNYTLSIVGMGNYSGVATAAWSIAKAAGSVSLSPTSLSLDMSNLTDIIEITRAGDGIITAQSSDPGIAATTIISQLYQAKKQNAVRSIAETATTSKIGNLTIGQTYVYLGESVDNEGYTWRKILFNGQIGWVTDPNSGTLIDNPDGCFVMVEAVSSGSATITVNVGAGTNHLATSTTASVSVQLIPALSECTPEQIQAVAQAGTGAQYWSIGDMIPIHISATSDLPNFTPPTEDVCAFIIGFDHNSSVEGTGIHFQFGKTTDGKDIAFCDSKYNSNEKSGSWFNMNNSNTNSGGWSSSRMRSTICPAFLSALPTAWKNIIASTTKYSDNTGGGSNTASHVTSTSDKIFLLSEWEVQGARTNANSAEKNYQVQYDYYKNGNSKIKYKHNATSTACIWGLRSVNVSGKDHFCLVTTGGKALPPGAYTSYGFAPGFRVA